MNKSNLISILKKFDARELREFGELVYSPFFNKNQSVIKLYDYLKKLHPEFENEKTKKEFVYSKIFHKAEYNDGFMRTVIFNLTSLAEQYLVQVNLKQKSAQGSLMLLDELNNRKLEKGLTKAFAETEKNIEMLKGVRNEYHYYRHVYEAIIQSYVNWSRFKTKNLKDYANEQILQENRSLANYFLIKTLSNYRLLLTKEENLTVEYDARLLEELMDYVQKNTDEFKDVPAVMLHVNEILLLKNKTDEYYYKLKEILLNEKGLTTNQKYSLHNIMQTYCVHKIYEGVSSFRRERFELFKLALKGNFYKGAEDIYFDDVMFPNMALSAIKENDIQWAEEFINSYEGMLSPANKDTVGGYIRGMLHFVKGEFDKALAVLSAVKSIRHHQYKVIIRNLILMTLYELSLYEKAEQQLASYRQYMSKNEKYFAPKRFERQVDFIKYYTLLLKAKEKPDADAVSKVIVELGKNTNVLERPWLLEKAAELENFTNKA